MKPVYAVTVMGNKAISSAVTQFELLYSLDGSIFSYAFNPMGQQLVSGSVDGDSGTRALEPTWCPPKRVGVMRSHSVPISCVAPPTVASYADGGWGGLEWCMV